MGNSSASLGQGRGETDKVVGKTGKSGGEPGASSFQGGISGTRGLHVYLGDVGNDNGSNRVTLAVQIVRIFTSKWPI